MQQRGKQVKALENCPTLILGLDFIYGAYNDLCGERGMTNIPWSSVANWCYLHGVCDIDEIARFSRIIRRMEKAQSDYEQKKAVK